jgi:hypothetical protein
VQAIIEESNVPPQRGHDTARNTRFFGEVPDVKAA